VLPKVPVMQLQVAGGVVNAAACMEENACYWLVLVKCMLWRLCRCHMSICQVQRGTFRFLECV
jgi:hypothetical protein